MDVFSGCLGNSLWNVFSGGLENLLWDVFSGGLGISLWNVFSGGLENLLWDGFSGGLGKSFKDIPVSRNLTAVYTGHKLTLWCGIFFLILAPSVCKM